MIIYFLKRKVTMRKIKSYIIASILGLLNVIPGNTHAKFVENKNCPRFYKQSEAYDGVQFFRSFNDNEENPVVFYKLLRILKNCDKESDGRKSEDCFEFLSKDSKFFDELKKYDYYSFNLNEIKEKANTDVFFKYLLDLYNKADSDAKGDKIEGTLLNDNPLDNMGTLCKGIDELNKLEPKLEIRSVEFNPNVFNFNVGGVPLRQKSIETFMGNCFISHGTAHQTLLDVIDSNKNLEQMKIKFKEYSGPKEIDNLTKGFVFFSLIPNGYHNELKESIRDRKWHYGISDLKRLPLVSISIDLVDCPQFIYNGPMSEALTARLFKEQERYRNPEFYRVSGLNELTYTEVRIPTYIIAPKQPNDLRAWTMRTKRGCLSNKKVWSKSEDTLNDTNKAFTTYINDEL